MLKRRLSNNTLYIVSLYLMIPLCLLIIFLAVRYYQFQRFKIGNPAFSPSRTWTLDEIDELIFSPKYWHPYHGPRVYFWDKSTWKSAPPYWVLQRELERRQFSERKANLLIKTLTFRPEAICIGEPFEFARHALESLIKNRAAISPSQRESVIRQLEFVFRAYLEFETESPRSLFFDIETVQLTIKAVRYFSRSKTREILLRMKCKLEENFGKSADERYQTVIKVLKQVLEVN